MTESLRDRTVAVIGAGTMGGGFVQLLALAGAVVRVADVTPQAAARAVAQATGQAREFERSGLMSPGSADAIAIATHAAPSIADAVAGTAVVFEAVAEQPQIKRDVLAAIEATADADCLIATNTSAIPITELAAELERPERFLGAHWFNPPQWVPCVEVIPHAGTEPAAVERTVRLLLELGKEPTVVGDAAGFVANRIQFAMFREAAAVVADGVASAEEVDRIVRSSFGFRLPFYGPFEIADMAGLDVYEGAYGALERAFGERISAPESLGELAAAGRLGVKTGAGYRHHDPEAVEWLLAERDASYVALLRLLAGRAKRQAAGV